MDGSIPKKARTVAYFSMEIGVDSRIPTYSGGLGVLAGDTIKSAADLSVPMVAITLLSEKGYFYQKINERGEQMELPVDWSMDDFLTEQDQTITVDIEGRQVKVKAWQYDVPGATGSDVPILFLDTDIEGNTDHDRALTSYLYGGDQHYRLCQEVILGMGGVKMLKALGFTGIMRYHMNEGHASLLVIELLKTKDHDEVKRQCVFTTHTPVAAGHDRFPLDLVRGVLADFPSIKEILDSEGKVNMTLIGLVYSHFVNGVAKRHGEVSQQMFPNYHIDAITNGVHSATWVSEPWNKVFTKHISGWKQDSFSLRYALNIPDDEAWDAHYAAKKKLIDYVNVQENAGMDYDMFTIGFARRATAYKRADLLFSDIERLKQIAQKCGRIQIIYGGKAHPNDSGGKEIIKRIIGLRNRLGNNIKLVYIQNYNMDLARMMVSGVDIWLNTPLRPKEASGTSGMKAAHNGVPHFSVLDGWSIEGNIEGVTGWSIGEKAIDQDAEVRDMYDKLENIIIPTFYKERKQWVDIMKKCIAINASFFNTHRMVQQYVLNAYFN